MSRLSEYSDLLLSRGRSYFSRHDALQALEMSPTALSAAIARQIKKGLFVSPRRGFYLIVRPEDRSFGAPNPVQWIEPLMQSISLDYRISLLSAATYHGSTHQAAMSFQVIAPRQLRKIEIGRHRIEFIYQEPATFKETNRPEWLARIKHREGFANLAGVELTLLDSTRYFHKAAGINGVAQIVHDLGSKAISKILEQAAVFYENSSVRRLGYLLESFGFKRLAASLLPFAQKAKSMKLFDPSASPVAQALQSNQARDTKWKLIINEPVEIDQ